MDEKIVEQILNDLYSSFEDAERQTNAILLFLKGEGIATEGKLAPYLEQAGRASDVRWRAARVRMASLLASAMNAPESPAQKQPAEEAAEKQNSPKAAAEAAEKDKSAGSSTKADSSDVKQESTAQKSQTAPEKKSEQGSEQKPRQAPEPKSSDANNAEKDAA
jgi:outer membrane biosynthesis protein TonB